jgi:hypothetical protein
MLSELGWIAMAVAMGTRPGRPAEDRVYLKRDGQEWVEVVSGPGGWRVLGPAAPPVSRGAVPPAGRCDLLSRYVAYPAGSSWPEAVAIGDVNSDGRNDVVMTTSLYNDFANDLKLMVFLQQPNGQLGPYKTHFTASNGSSPPQTVAIGDVTGDGRNDVVIGNSRWRVGVFRQNTAGGLDPVVTYDTVDSTRVRIADLNGDGRQDVVGIGWGTDTVSVLLQQPNGALAAPVVYSAPHAGYDDLEVGDLNDDGRTDVLVMSGQSYATPNFSVLYQQVNGTLGGLVSRSVGVNQTAGGVGLGDVDHDGGNDVAVAMNWAGTGVPSIALFHQDGAGGLPAQPSATVLTTTYPEPVEVGDLDGDGRSDVLVVDGEVKLGVYLQTPQGTLGPERIFAVPYATHYNRHGLAMGDIDGDELSDVVIANYNYGLVVLRHPPPLSAPCPGP